MHDTPKAQEVIESIRTELTVDVRTAAAALGVHPQAIYDAVSRREIPAVKVGRRIRISSLHLRHALGME